MSVNQTEPAEYARIQAAIQGLNEPAYPGYPPSVTRDIGAYLAGEAPLAQALAAWERLGYMNNSLQYRWPSFLVESQFEHAGAQLERLDAFDRRLIHLQFACAARRRRPDAAARYYGWSRRSQM
ncbi:MAG TPA: hypothetical protein VMV29_10210 [Ktedonobacterales bacterium]|nr:hypothetical protein [Ktedonobacterales bacterium]